METQRELVKGILKDYNLRLTEAREIVLSFFLTQPNTLSHADIEAHTPIADRVTIYRTLRTFVEKGILHTIPDEVHNVRYALCHHHHCGPAKHSHNHIHFKCLKCGLTTCMENVVIPLVSLPLGYRVVEANYIIQGVCDKCVKEDA